MVLIQDAAVQFAFVDMSALLIFRDDTINKSIFFYFNSYFVYHVNIFWINNKFRNVKLF